MGAPAATRLDRTHSRRWPRGSAVVAALALLLLLPGGARGEARRSAAVPGGTAVAQAGPAPETPATRPAEEAPPAQPAPREDAPEPTAAPDDRGGEAHDGASGEPAADTDKPAQPAAAAEEEAEEDEDDEEEGADDWETDSGPVDRKPHISGALQGSYRATFFSRDTLPDGKALEKSNSFQLEHTHLKFSGDLTHALSWEVMPCVTHMNNFSVITANFSYQFHTALAVTFGRFLLPFGQFNVRSLPGSYIPIARPLLYQSHESETITFDKVTPKGFLFTPRDDLGLQLTGSVWFGPQDIFQLSYAGFVTNGLRATSDQQSRSWNDNNAAKQYGGRLSLSYNGMRLIASLGASGLLNKYDADLRQTALAADALLSLTYRQNRKLTLRGELVRMQREIQPTTELLQGDEEISGAYVTAEADVLAWLTAYYQWDVLMNRLPRAQLNENFRDVEPSMTRHAAGVLASVGGVLQLKLEYSYWLTPMGFPDAHRVSAQSVVLF